MRKISLILALMAGMMLPLAVCQEGVAKEKTSKSSSKKKKKKKKKDDEPPPPEEVKRSDQRVEFSDEQTMLNNQATEATLAKNFLKAEKLYVALNQLGETNVVWYNLGKTYAAENKCSEAYDAFGRVDGAPKISSIDVETIHDAKEEGLKALAIQCSAKAVMVCSPAEMVLSVDGGEEFECDDDPVPVVPGKHSVYAKTSFGFTNVSFTVAEGETRQLKIDVVNYEEYVETAGVTIEELEHRTKVFKTLGWSFFGAGMALAGASAGVVGYKIMDYKDYVSEIDQKNYREANRREDETYLYQKIMWPVMGVGGVLAVTGAALLIYNKVKVEPQLEELRRILSFDVEPTFSPEFSGITLSGRF